MTALHPTRRGILKSVGGLGTAPAPGGHVIRPDLMRQDSDGITDRLRKA
ncbi:hypothetical protein ACIRVF_17120 [Kitasatospora sp. NPDC101157]